MFIEHLLHAKPLKYSLWTINNYHFPHFASERTELEMLRNLSTSTRLLCGQEYFLCMASDTKGPWGAA